jgi:hypothetical protein
VFLFGGAKSSLRSSATPFVAAQAFVYSDPVKHYRKLNDLVILESFQGLRESYAKLWSASVMAEIAIKTPGLRRRVPDAARPLPFPASRPRPGRRGGGRDQASGLSLEIPGIMGLQPDWSRCVVCGKRIQPRKGEPLSSPILYYSPRLDGFACPDCGPKDSDLAPRISIYWIDSAQRRSKTAAVPPGKPKPRFAALPPLLPFPEGGGRRSPEPRDRSGINHRAKMKYSI